MAARPGRTTEAEALAWPAAPRVEAGAGEEDGTPAEDGEPEAEIDPGSQEDVYAWRDDEPIAVAA